MIANTRSEAGRRARAIARLRLPASLNWLILKVNPWDSETGKQRLPASLKPLILFQTGWAAAYISRWRVFARLSFLRSTAFGETRGTRTKRTDQ